MMIRAGLLAIAGLMGLVPSGRDRNDDDDRAAVAGLDKQYQEAVRRKDSATMSRILADDFVLVTGKGRIYTKTELLAEAADTAVRYDRNEDSAQTVRVWGQTAVVTALLWETGVDHGRPFDRRLWFSDTYARTATGWRYVFGQSTLPIP